MNSNLALIAWYLDHGVDMALQETPHNRFAVPKPALAAEPITDSPPQTVTKTSLQPEITVPLGTQDAYAQAVELAAAANTLEELKTSILNFDGLAIKKTATQIVFADGNPKAHVMLIGEAPGADEDRQGLPFSGHSGQLLDKILASIGLDRASGDAANSAYVSNILNWRPPGNRTPTPAEMQISLPFIEKHIALIQPKILILCGAIAAKTILGRQDSISKMRKTAHNFTPRSLKNIVLPHEITAFATYHPAYLLRTPIQKRAVWEDMLKIKQKIQSLP